MGVRNHRDGSHHGYGRALGTILLLNLRLLGMAFNNRPVTKLATDLRPWTGGSIGLMIVTGTMLFTSEAVRLSVSSPFFYKIILLLLALGSYFTTSQIVVRGATTNRLMIKITVFVSLGLWFGVAIAGRSIAFL
jgi:hypothetical protein